MDHVAVLRADLGQTVVPLTPNIFSRHRRTAHRDLADLSYWQHFSDRQWLVTDRQDLYLHPVHWAANADPTPLGGEITRLSQDFLAGNDRDWQSFGRAINAEQLTVGWQEFDELL